MKARRPASSSGPDYERKRRTDAWPEIGQVLLRQVRDRDGTISVDEVMVSHIRWVGNPSGGLLPEFVWLSNGDMFQTLSWRFVGDRKIPRRRVWPPRGWRLK